MARRTSPRVPPVKIAMRIVHCPFTVTVVALEGSSDPDLCARYGLAGRAGFLPSSSTGWPSDQVPYPPLVRAGRAMKFLARLLYGLAEQ